jgi:hypothetical protein
MKDKSVLYHKVLLTHVYGYGLNKHNGNGHATIISLCVKVLNPEKFYSICGNLYIFSVVRKELQAETDLFNNKS